MSQLLRVQYFGVSRDGFGAGEGQSLERPFGHADPADLISWAGATASWPNRTDPAAPAAWTTTSPATSSATSVPRSWAATSSAPAGPWENHDWKGWWGDTPPFHTPVFVLTHHERPSSRWPTPRSTSSTPHPAEALRQAKEAADGKDVRLGGGVATVREFLEADLVDTMHVAVAPVELGRGERLWDSPEDLLDRFHLETVPSPSGVTHLLFWRR